MFRAISSWISKMSLSSRSKDSDQRWNPPEVSTSWAVIRSRLPDLRTLPSRMRLDAQPPADLPGLDRRAPPNWKEAVRDATRSPLRRHRALMISSAMPSQK